MVRCCMGEQAPQQILSQPELVREILHAAPLQGEVFGNTEADDGVDAEVWVALSVVNVGF